MVTRAMKLRYADTYKKRTCGLTDGEHYIVECALFPYQLFTERLRRSCSILNASQGGSDAHTYIQS